MASEGETGNRVLLIEDNADAAWGLAELLGVSGYEVSVAHDVDAGLSLLRENPPNAVLCDINLGRNRPSGYDFARTVRDDPSLSHLQLISVSGYGQPKHFAESKSAGFNQHMVKPLSLEGLESALRTLMTESGVGKNFCSR